MWLVMPGSVPTSDRDRRLLPYIYFERSSISQMTTVPYDESLLPKLKGKVVIITGMQREM
jgi:hypothetical protein